MLFINDIDKLKSKIINLQNTTLTLKNGINTEFVSLSKSHIIFLCYSKSNKSFTFTPRLSAIIFNFVIVVSDNASSIKLIIPLEIPFTPKSSWVRFRSFLNWTKCFANFCKYVLFIFILLAMLALQTTSHTCK